MTGPDCARCGRPPESHPEPSPASEGSKIDLNSPNGQTRTIKPLRAVRHMSARRTSGTCPLCQQILNAGRQIGLIRGLGWCHAACIVVHNREISTEAR